MKRYTSFFLLMLISFFSQAQTNEGLMQRDGKLFVVIAVVLVILSGLFFYVWQLDKKISKIEENTNE